MENKSLKGLKKKAIELGIKEPGVGWSTCCPPKGRKADIIKAIKKKEKGRLPEAAKTTQRIFIRAVANGDIDRVRRLLAMNVNFGNATDAGGNSALDVAAMHGHTDIVKLIKEKVVDECIRQTTKKYTQRKSPPYPGAKCCDIVKNGNDGREYISELRGRNKSCRWYLRSPKAKAKKAKAKKAKSPKAKVKKSNCRKFRKTKAPKCNDQPGCKWVVGKGCISALQQTFSPSPAPGIGAGAPLPWGVGYPDDPIPVIPSVDTSGWQGPQYEGTVTRFMTCDNGGHPYMVEITPTYVKVFTHGKSRVSQSGNILYGASERELPHRVSDICPVDWAYYDVYAGGWKNYIRCGLYNELVEMDVDGRSVPALFNRSLIRKIFIGLDYTKEKDQPPGWPKPVDRDQGNSILLALKDGRNVFIGDSIYEFKSEGPILEYYSNVGRSSVPYPVALDANNVYFMLDKTYVPIKEIPRPFHMLMGDAETHPIHMIGPAEKGDLYGDYYEEGWSDFKSEPMKDVKVLTKRNIDVPDWVLDELE